MARSFGIWGGETGTISDAGTELNVSLSALAARTGNYGLLQDITGGAVISGFNPTVVTTDMNNINTTGINFGFRFRFFFKIITLPAFTDLTIGGLGLPGNSQTPTTTLFLNNLGQLKVEAAGVTSVGYEGSLSTGVWYRVDFETYGNIINTGTDDPNADVVQTCTIYDEDGSIVVDQGYVRTFFSSHTIVMPTGLTVGSDVSKGNRTIYFDDIYWDFTRDSEYLQGDWPRGTHVAPFPVTGQGSGDGWTPAGAYQNVDEIPFSGADTITSNVIGNRTSYTHEASGPAAYAIRIYTRWSGGNTSQYLEWDSASVATNCPTSAGVKWADYTYVGAIPSNIPGPQFSAAEYGASQLNDATITMSAIFMEALIDDPILAEAEISGLSLDIDSTGGEPIEGDATIALTGTLGFRLTNQGEEINVPTTWRIDGIQVGPRKEQTN